MSVSPFRHIIKVSTGDIDELGHVNNVVYVRWVQEVAAAHWDHVASVDLRLKYSWVVLRHEIDYKNPVYRNEEVIGTTWVGEHRGARFDRYVKLVSAKNDKILAEAKTTWCMLDSQSMRPVRITEEVLGVL